jgi:hypothetical protein
MPARKARSPYARQFVSLHECQGSVFARFSQLVEFERSLSTTGMETARPAKVAMLSVVMEESLMIAVYDRSKGKDIERFKERSVSQEHDWSSICCKFRLFCYNCSNEPFIEAMLDDQDSNLGPRVANFSKVVISRTLCRFTTAPSCTCPKLQLRRCTTMFSLTQSVSQAYSDDRALFQVRSI